ncbi:MAG: RNA 2'-phosphotransferase [Deltaproteobacteria bacterium]|nr:RNA 2'-phosphotransferase [Deltaproteobacteria bacterium]
MSRSDQQATKNNKHRDTESSKKMSWLLRHGAREQGLAMTDDGWAQIADVLRVLGLSRDTLDRVVADNAKKRFECDGERIRACQGHSLGVVVADEIESTWVLDTERTALVWHGTSVAALDGIARDGICAVSRTHVHCAADPDATVGKRAGVDVLLGISPVSLRERGEQVFRSPNGVILVRHIAVTSIVAVRACTRLGESSLARARALFSIES